MFVFDQVVKRNILFSAWSSLWTSHLKQQLPQILKVARVYFCYFSSDPYQSCQSWKAHSSPPPPPRTRLNCTKLKLISILILREKTFPLRRRILLRSELAATKIGQNILSAKYFFFRAVHWDIYVWTHLVRKERNKRN